MTRSLPATVAVVVTTYNRPDALAAVLEGLQAQTDRHFEILVADDGSRDETRRLVEAFARRKLIPVQHVWHEDHGFRAGAIRNRAIAATDADYVIFTDGDCIPRPDFVAQHRRAAECGWFVSGNRVLLSEAFTKEVLEQRLPVHCWSTARWLSARVRGQINRWLPLCRIPSPGWLGKLRSRRWQGARTCNLAAWRDDLLTVNGFDESYTGWGLEDSDLAIRLLHAGVHHKQARFVVPVFHLWHRENSRHNLAENQQRLDEIMASGRVRAQVGVDQYFVQNQRRAA